MVNIDLKKGQSGYDAVGEYVLRYWQHHAVDTVIVRLRISYDGVYYDDVTDTASPLHFNDIEFGYDWWEGQKYIMLCGIMSLSDVVVSGGIYEDEPELDGVPHGCV